MWVQSWKLHLVRQTLSLPHTTICLWVNHAWVILLRLSSTVNLLWQNLSILLVSQLERINGSQLGYNYKSDIWSLGLILLEYAIGRFPYTLLIKLKYGKVFLSLLKQSLKLIHMRIPCVANKNNDHVIYNILYDGIYIM